MEARDEIAERRVRTVVSNKVIDFHLLPHILCASHRYLVFHEFKHGSMLLLHILLHLGPERADGSLQFLLPVVHHRHPVPI